MPLQSSSRGRLPSAVDEHADCREIARSEEADTACDRADWPVTSEAAVGSECSDGAIPLRHYDGTGCCRKSGAAGGRNGAARKGTRRDHPPGSRRTTGTRSQHGEFCPATGQISTTEQSRLSHGRPHTGPRFARSRKTAPHDPFDRSDTAPLPARARATPRGLRYRGHSRPHTRTHATGG